MQIFEKGCLKEFTYQDVFLQILNIDAYILTSFQLFACIKITFKTKLNYKRKLNNIKFWIKDA